ncbi:MAG TPA: DUF4418 family protein [Patescibacteria group bacterium]|nr:DUF4418 family protein [Patescibacteria group bacterium]
MRNTKWAGGLALLASLALIAIPNSLPRCAGNMRCNLAFNADLILALLALVVAIYSFYLTNNESRRLVGVLQALLGVGVIAVLQPGVIGLCASPHMHCHHTAPWLIGAGVVLSASGLWQIWLARSVVSDHITNGGG